VEYGCRERESAVGKNLCCIDRKSGNNDTGSCQEANAGQRTSASGFAATRPAPRAVLVEL
jgi:hypothetical protein